MVRICCSYLQCGIWWCVCVAPTFGSLPCLSMRDMMVRICCSYLWVSAMFVNERYDGAYVLLLPLGLCHVCQWVIRWCICVAPTFGSLPCLSMRDMMVHMCCSYLWVSAMFVNERYDGAYVLLLPLGLCHVCQWEIWWCVCVAPTFGSLPCLSMRDMMVHMCCSYLWVSAMFVNERYDGAHVLLLPLGLCHVCQWEIWWCVYVAPTFGSLPYLSMRDMMVRMCCSYLWVSAMFVNERYDGAYVLLLPLGLCHVCQWEIWWCVCVAPTFGSLPCLSMRDMMVRICCSYLQCGIWWCVCVAPTFGSLPCLSMRDMMVRMCCSYLWVSAMFVNERYDGAYVLLLPLGLCHVCQWEIWWCVCVAPTFGSLPCLSMSDMMVRICCSYLWVSAMFVNEWYDGAYVLLLPLGLCHVCQWEIWWCVCVAPTFGSLPCLSMSDMMVRMCCSYLWISAMFVNEWYDGAYVLLLPLGLCHVCQWVIWWCVCVAPTFGSLPCLSMSDMMVRMCCSYLLCHVCQWVIWWCVCVAPTFGSLPCLSMSDMMVRMCCSYLWVSAMFVNEWYDGAYVLLLPLGLCHVCQWVIWWCVCVAPTFGSLPCLSMRDMMVRMCCSYLWVSAMFVNERYVGGYVLLLPLGLCHVCQWVIWWCVCVAPTFGSLPCLSMRDMMVRMCCSYLQWEIWWCVCVAPTFGSLPCLSMRDMMVRICCSYLWISAMFVNEWYDGAYVLLLPLGLCHVCQWVIWWCVYVAPTFGSLPCLSMSDMMVRICCSYLWVSAMFVNERYDGAYMLLLPLGLCHVCQWEIWWCVYVAPTFGSLPCLSMRDMMVRICCSYLWVSAMFVNERYDGAYMLLLPLGLCHVCQWVIWWCVYVAPTFGSLPCLSMRDMMVRICCSYLLCHVCQWVIWWCVCVAPTFGSLPCLSMSDMMVRMCCSYLWVSAMFVNEWYDGAYMLLLPLGLCHVCQWVIWWCVCVAPTFGSLPCLSMRDMMVRMCCSYLWVSAMFVNERYDGAYVVLLPLGLCHVCQGEIWWCVCVAPTFGSLPCLSMRDMMVRMCCSYLWVSAMFVNERYDGAYVLLLPLGLCHVCQGEIWWCVCVAPTFGSLPCLSMRDMMVRMCCSYLWVSAMFVNERYDGAYVLLLPSDLCHVCQWVIWWCVYVAPWWRSRPQDCQWGRSVGHPTHLVTRQWQCVTAGHCNTPVNVYLKHGG